MLNPELMISSSLGIEEIFITTKVESSVFIDAPVEKVFSRITQHDSCNDWLEFVSSARYTSKEKTGMGVSAHHSGQVMGKKMEWDGRIIEWAENDRIVWQAISGTPEAMRMKAVNRVEKEGWHSLLFGSGICATLLNPRQNHGSDHDQEEHTENGPTFNQEPEDNSRTMIG